MVDVRALARVLCPAAALWLSACSTVSSSSDDPIGTDHAGTGSGAVGGTEVAGAGAVATGGTGTLPEKIEPQTVEERCADLDAELPGPRPAGWDVDSHCKEAAPSYDVLFGTDIKRLDIVVTPEAYAAMELDLEELMNGEGPGPSEPSGCDGLQVGDACQDDFGGGVGECTDWFGELVCYVEPPASETDPCANRQEVDSCTIEAEPGHCFSDGFTLVCLLDDPGVSVGRSDTCSSSFPGDSCQLGGSASQGVCAESGRLISCQGPLDRTAEPPVAVDEAVPFWSRDPVYVEATVRFEGQEWTHVGYRYKGNHGLVAAAPNKRPFRLKLDELEDAYPEITDQRLYGFKELSFSPGGGVGTPARANISADRTCRR